MRILSLGFPLPGAAIDNYSFISAPAFFDYDALVVDPRALSQLIEDVCGGTVEHLSYSGERMVNRSGHSGEVSLAELLHNRADETARLLARGGLVVCLAVPSAAHECVLGLASVDRYYWLPVQAGLAYGGSFMKRAGGTQFGSFDANHPFGVMLCQVRAKLAYQVHFDDETHGFTGEVIGRSIGGAAIGISLPVSAGEIVLLPPPARPLDSQGRYELSDALQQAIRQVLRHSSASAAPKWLTEYGLPGLDELVAAHDEAGRRLTEAQETLDGADRALEELRCYQQLLWEDGNSLKEAVAEGLSVIGFQATPAASDTSPQIELEAAPHERRVALLEVDASDEVVGLDAHYRLRHRLEEALTRGSVQRGLLVINGYRRTPPSERAQQFSNELRLAAEHLRYCLVTTEHIFHAVRASLNGDDATVTRFRERLLTIDGALLED